MAPEIESGGKLLYGVNVNVTMEQMREWPPARIQQFFEGLAAMLGAVAGIPSSAKGSK